MNQEPRPQPRTGALHPDSPELQERADHDRPIIWVGSLSDYNNGILYGAWLNAAQSADDLRAGIQAMLEGSPWMARSGEPAEEWGIFDYENFGALRLGEYENLSRVSALARGIEEHGPAFAAWAQIVEEDERLNDFSESYLDHYDSVQAYAEQLVDDLGYPELLDQAMPGSIRGYVQIDATALARDMQLGGDVVAVSAEVNGVWLFDSR